MNENKEIIIMEGDDHIKVTVEIKSEIPEFIINYIRGDIYSLMADYYSIKGNPLLLPMFKEIDIKNSLDKVELVKGFF